MSAFPPEDAKAREGDNRGAGLTRDIRSLAKKDDADQQSVEQSRLAIGRDRRYIAGSENDCCEAERKSSRKDEQHQDRIVAPDGRLFNISKQRQHEAEHALDDK
ncbi:MAG: hypothetical protein HWE33_00820 [Rhodobacteraceae bacterium]|nr:hypothetical protein [Paracoccaceae bacterium]